MSDMELTIRVPEELVERAHAVGLEIDTLAPELLAFLEQQIEQRRITETDAFDYQAWWAGVEAIQARLSAHYGDQYHTNALDLLRELREDDE